MHYGLLRMKLMRTKMTSSYDVIMIGLLDWRQQSAPNRRQRALLAYTVHVFTMLHSQTDDICTENVLRFFTFACRYFFNEYFELLYLLKLIYTV